MKPCSVYYLKILERSSIEEKRKEEIAQKVKGFFAEPKTQ